MLGKVEEYFDAGVRVVWLILPTMEVVYVYTSFVQVEVVTRGQTLTGGAVVPGFELPLADLFERYEEAEETIAEPEPTT